MKNKLFNILIGLGVTFIVIYLLTMLVNPTLNDDSKFRIGGDIPGWQYLVWILIFSPFLEELLYRHLPFSILRDTPFYTDKNKYIYSGFYSYVIWSKTWRLQ